jgi:uncharacterized protein (DUF305 family)
MTSRTVRIAATAAVLAAAAFGTACGASSTDEHARSTATAAARAGEAATHDADDVAFAQNMIPHHEQAVDMAGLAITNTTNADVIALANQITTAQLPEVQAFRAWLVQWGEPETDGHGGHGAMAGMVDQATLDQLKSLRGPEFDKLWLQSMIAHHQGAITMAQQEIGHGQNQDLISMAKSIVSAQQAEIDKMRQLLGG